MLAAAPAFAGDWPTFQGSAVHLGIAEDIALPLEKAWTYEMKTAVFSSPVVAGGTIFVAGENGTVAALGTDGSPRWKVRLEGSIYASTPSIADGLLFIGSVKGRGARSGRVRALSIADGSVRWTFEAPADVYSSPLVVGNLVVVGCDDSNVYALDRASGRVVWKSRTSGMVHDNAAAPGDGVVYIGSYDGCLYALETATGRQLWKFKTRKRVNTAAVVEGGAVYFGAEDGKLYMLSVSDGTLRWSFKTRAAVVGAPAVTADAVYLGSSDGTLYVLSRNGEKKWSYKVGSHVVASPLVSGGHVYTAAIDTLAMLDQKLLALDVVTGKPAWAFMLKGPLFASLAVSDGLMVVASKKGWLYGFRSRGKTG